jgi:ERCC4-type nuclease
MRIVIDNREGELIVRMNEIFSLLPEDKKKRIEIVIGNLPIGDILIQNPSNAKRSADLVVGGFQPPDQKIVDKTLLIIERKTFSDLLASIKDGRYEEQSHRLLNAGGVPPHSIIYLLEGMFSSLREPSHKKIIYSAMTSLNYFKGFSVMRTSSVYETAEWLIAMTDKLDRELEKEIVKNILDEPVGGGIVNESVEGEPQVSYSNFVKKIKKDNITPENIGEIVLSQIPGISAVTATAIMKKFSTFPKLLTALKENSQCMNDIMLENAGKSRKISKSSVENIKKFFSE